MPKRLSASGFAKGSSRAREPKPPSFNARCGLMDDSEGEDFGLKRSGRLNAGKEKLTAGASADTVAAFFASVSDAPSVSAAAAAGAALPTWRLAASCCASSPCCPAPCSKPGPPTDLNCDDHGWQPS